MIRTMVQEHKNMMTREVGVLTMMIGVVPDSMGPFSSPQDVQGQGEGYLIPPSLATVSLPAYSALVSIPQIIYMWIDGSCIQDNTECAG